MKVYWYRILLVGVVSLWGCTGSGPVEKISPPAPEPPTATAVGQVRQLQRLADEVLVCLATHNYSKLKTFLSPSLPLTGREVALRLLGPHATTMVLDRWDAQKIDVSFSENSRHARAQATISYRPKPNRMAKKGIISLLFRQSTKSDNWILVLP